MGINPVEGNSLVVHSAVYEGGKLSMVTDRPVVLIFTPEKMRLLPVVSQGRGYDVPTMHLGDAINPEDVIGIAELGVTYYAKVLDSAEAFFVTN